jgi:hypothetical protein
MVGGSTSYTHKLITHFSLTLGSVCMSVSVGVRVRVRARTCACALKCVCMRAHENKAETNFFIF